MGAEESTSPDALDQSPMPSPSEWTRNSISSRSSHSSSSVSASTSNTSASAAGPASLMMTPDSKAPYQAMEALVLKSPIKPLRRSLTPESGSGPTPSSPSASASGGSEVNDMLTPLPDDEKAVVLGSRQWNPASLRLTPNFGSGSKSAMSPPLGLSELLSGSPRSQDGDCYFSGNYSQHVEPDPQPNTVHRRPAYSPFRSYYGEQSPKVKKTDAAAQERAMRRRSVETPDITPVSTPKSAPSEGSSSSRSSRQRRPPSVKNTDSVLAPHGSFTSAKPLTRSSSRKSHARPIATAINFDDGLDPIERDKLIEAAASGDQLAMHRLGWRRPQAPSRYSLGTVETVWGNTSSNDHIRRSSLESQDSTQSPSSEQRFSSSERPRRRNSDLLVDAARLARRANYLESRQTRKIEAPPSPE